MGRLDVVQGIARRRPARIIGLAAVAAGVFVLFIFVLPRLLANGTFANDAERLKAENDVRATLLQGLGGAFLLLGLYFTARTLQLNREGQITERFTRAIDQLGSDTLDVRLGGIYALERIARDSENDRETIFAVLAAFIREHGPWLPDDASDVEDGTPPERGGRPSEDVWTAATVLGKRTGRRGDRALDLSRSDLRSGDLGHAYLVGANLRRSNLAGAYLGGANLWGAYLTGADLRGAVFDSADLAYAQLGGANLAGANLNLATLQHATLAGANLLRASFGGADLLDANLRGAKLEGATLFGANLENANVQDADLCGANLEGAKNLDLGRYISGLPRKEQNAFLDSQKAWLDSLSPEEMMAKFSLTPADIAKFADAKAPTRDSPEEESGDAVT